VHHPDRNATSSIGERDRAEEQMRLVNAAWSVLSAPDRRAAYDREIGVVDEHSSAFVRKLSHEGFVPYHEVDEDDDDAWRYEPDVGDPRSAPSRRTTMIPMVMTAVTVALVVAWMIIDADPVGIAALVAGVVAAISFFMLPIVAMAKAADFEKS